MPLSQGRVLNNRYRIVKLLGQGGFGVVYRAWDTSLQRPIALKENLDTSSEAQRQFEREAQILARLMHPALPRVMDHFAIPGQGQYLVMDYVEGEDLSDKLAQAGGALPEAQVVGWIIQVCQALDYLHSQKSPIIHRDIKPANIRITSQGQAMLVDFGIAKVYDPKLSTTMGARAVTPGYSPPEQYGMGSTNAQSDIYALGATTYHLLTGQMPTESVQRMMGAALPEPHTLNPAISPRVEQALLKAMSPMPADRYAIASGFAAALLGSHPLPGDSKPVVHVTSALPQPAQTSVAASSAPTPGPAGAATPRIFPVAQPLPASQPLSARIPPWLWAAGALGLLGICAILAVLSANPDPTPTAVPVVDVITLTVTPVTEIPQITTPAGITEVPVVTTSAPNPLPPDSSVTPTPTETATATATATTAPLPPEPSGDLPPACTAAGQSWTSPKDGMTLLCVPAGEFSMGSDPSFDSNTEANETPQHSVYLDAFWMDLTEVTNAMYAQCVNAGVCAVPDKDSSYTNSNYYGASAFDNYPVMHIVRDEAQAYCQWRGGRLPSEAEWEKAARGTDGRIYPWGNDFDGNRLNFCDSNCPRRKPDASYNDGYPDVASVGSFPSGASPYGLLDMAGNVFEYVLDWYGETYYASSPASNPFGPSSGDVYVVRGGAWDSKASVVRTAVRYWIQPQVSLDYVGFRCMMSAP